MEWMKNRERELLYLLNGKLRTPVLDRLMRGVTHAGGATFSIGLLFVLTLFFRYSWKGLAALAASHGVVHIMKKSFKRKRPYIVESSVIFDEKPLQDCSFPSGHTTAAFAAAITVAVHAAWLAPIALPAAFLVGWSRIYLGFHYPADVAAGALIGTIAALLFFWI